MNAWREIVVRAPDAAWRAFVAGFLAGRGADDPVVFGGDVDLEPESLGERLRELFTGGSHAVAFAAEPAAAALTDAAERHGEAVGIRVERTRVVRNARFTFQATAFAKSAADALRSALRSLPDGVATTDVEEHEELHPDAGGVELYAPIHRYNYRVSGTIQGPFPGVLEMYRGLRDMDCVDVSRLRVESDESTGDVA